MDKAKPFSFNLSPLTSIEQIRPELTWQLRRDTLYPAMLRQEMGMEEDGDGIHFGLFTENKLAGVVSLFQNGTAFQFRKLAVDAAMQHKGLGSILVNYITNFAEENGGTLIWCNARVDAVAFYLKLNFVQTGRFFTKKGIDYEVTEKAITPVSNHTQ
jgi:phosphoribosylformimino-5-aminoimidazole carboxamide ribotide isomerase